MHRVNQLVFAMIMASLIYGEIVRWAVHCDDEGLGSVSPSTSLACLGDFLELPLYASTSELASARLSLARFLFFVHSSLHTVVERGRFP